MKQLSQEKLAELVRSRRSELSLTQEELCEKTGIHRTMIGRIERMDYLPTIPQLEKLAEVLKFEIEELFISSRPMVFTAFRGKNLTEEEQNGVDHLFEMMLIAKQQILLRRALDDEKNN